MTQEQNQGGFPRQGVWTYRLKRRMQKLWQRVPGNCPACSQRTAGGHLCCQCVSALVSSMRCAGKVSDKNDPSGIQRPTGAEAAAQEQAGKAQVLFRCCRCALRLPALLTCPDCAAGPLAVSKVMAAFDYDAPSGKELIRRFKQGRQFLLSQSLARLMAAEVQRNKKISANISQYILVPVPAHKASIRERGFSPSAELAKDLARELGLICRMGLLRRRGDGVRQTGQTRKQRLALTNAQDYDCHGLAHNVRVILVDDVMTTGSTLHQAATALRQAGAADVMAVVLARTPLN